INSFSSNHVDRDLSRTGLSTVVITPSFGVFDVQKKLLRMTTERMLHYGMRVDLVCLAPKPLFRPPVFRYKSLPVPPEKDQHRAMYLRTQGNLGTNAAKAAEVSSASPAADAAGDSGGYISAAAAAAAPAKERVSKGIAGPMAEAMLSVDPIMMDPLYFNEEYWENELLPYLTGSRLKNDTGHSNSGREQHSGASNAGAASLNRGSQPNCGSGSVIGVLLSDKDTTVGDIPKSINDLTLDEYPFFTPDTSTLDVDRRVVHCYFPYWVDCGFYNYTDERDVDRPDDFRPVCKMGDLSVNGVASYLHRPPTIPDLELRAMDTELASLLGLEAHLESSTESVAGEVLHSQLTRGDKSSSTEARHMASLSKDGPHGRSVRLATVSDREALKELFDKFDRQAIVGTDVASVAPSGELVYVAGATHPNNGHMAASFTAAGLSFLGSGGIGTGSGEHRYPLSHTPGTVHATQLSALPSNASANWDDSNSHPHQQPHSHQNSQRHPDLRTSVSADIGLSASADTAEHMLATVSTSASPNLHYGHLSKLPLEKFQSQSVSSSVPREAKLSSGVNSSALRQRSSVFMRSSAQRKRPQQQQQNLGFKADTPEADVHAAAAHSSLQQQSERRHPSSSAGLSSDMTAPVAVAAAATASSTSDTAGNAKWRGATPDKAAQSGADPVIELPQSVNRAQYIQGGWEMAAKDPLMIPQAPSGRSGVSESMTKQSHLDDHIRTFKGAAAGHDVGHQQQSIHYFNSGTVNPVSTVQRHSALSSVLISDPEFQLTLPSGQQTASASSIVAATAGTMGTALRTTSTLPAVSGGHKGSSPQYGRTAWISDRHSLTAQPTDLSQHWPRSRHYYSYNPCNPHTELLPNTVVSQRWALAFPTYWLVSSYTPKWRSLCTPASLPLVTDYRPKDLETFYTQYPYHVQTPDIDLYDSGNLPLDDYDEFAQFMTGHTATSASAVFTVGSRANIGAVSSGAVMSGSMTNSQKTDRLTRIRLKEMVYQRLAQGFQFINVGDSPLGAGKNAGNLLPRIGNRGVRTKLSGARPDSGDRMGGRGCNEPTSLSGSPHSSLLPAGAMQNSEKAVWLSNGRQIQKLKLQETNGPSLTPGIAVTRWERIKRFDQTDYKYRLQMWSRNNKLGYMPADLGFCYPHDEEVNWNNLDYLLLGYQPNLNKSAKYWRTRYILIPVDQLGNDTIVNTKSNPLLSVEDVRIANFEKFLDHILRMLRKDERKKLEDRFLGALPSDMIRSSAVFGNQASSEWGQPKQLQEQQPRQKSVAGVAPTTSVVAGSTAQPPAQQPVHTTSTSVGVDGKKTIGLNSLMPSALMQIRYTTMYPVPYLINQLYYYMNDNIFSDPSLPISLPTPAAPTLGLHESLNVESPFAQLAYALQHQKAGVRLRNIRWHYVYFSSIFVGYQLVDWMLVNFEGVTRRSLAVAAGNRLMDRGLFVSAQNKNRFMDGHHFYSFTDSVLAHKGQQLATTQQQVAAAPARGAQSSLMSSIGLGDKMGRYGTGSNNPSPNTSRPASRQGSKAPSMINEGDSTTVSAATVSMGASTSATPVATALGGTGTASKKHTLTKTSMSRETTHDLSSDPWASESQPVSKLRARTDTGGNLAAFSAAVTELASSKSAAHAGETDSGSSKSQREAGAVDNCNRPGRQQRLHTRASQAGRFSDGNVAADEHNAARSSGQVAPPSVGIEGIEYTRTPDVFPKLSARKSKRPLPKTLHQSRMFGLDLDQQRKSTRSEHCLVHLDAVQNPMTCFHLSINWLNCTNYRIDDMVRGWARMAERCGMRLVEAPRAQDTSIEDCHPFHSPIRINLGLPPPPVEGIFDDEWVSDFAYFGNSDSEPDISDDDGYNSNASEGSSESAKSVDSERALLAQRARTVKRMSKCIPTYPFERELLEEQDFILDVEAEDSHPHTSMLNREYTFTRQKHEYTQYVHRSGTAFVQICGPGEFLWINNYLFTSHQTHLRPQQLNNHQQLQATATSQMSLGSYSMIRGDSGPAPAPASSGPAAATLAAAGMAMGTTVSASDTSAVSTPPSSSARQTIRTSAQHQAYQYQHQHQHQHQHLHQHLLKSGSL
ncbi:vacuolar membrane-associated protein iml1, partial [Kickxella alabastrina]